MTITSELIEALGITKEDVLDRKRAYFQEVADFLDFERGMNFDYEGAV